MGYRNDRSKSSHQFRPSMSDLLEQRNLLSSLTLTAQDHSRAAAVVQETHSSHARGAAMKASSSTDHPRAAANATINAPLQKGYTIKPFATGLNFPDSIAFGPNGKMWVSETAFAPGQIPRIDQIKSNGTATPILSANQLPPFALEGPITDITYHQGWIWVTALQRRSDGLDVGAITKFRPSNPVGTFTTVISNLPSFGGGYTFKVVFQGRRAYFSEGTVTNSSIVDTADLVPGSQTLLATDSGLSSAFHDYAPVSLILSGTSYVTMNALTGAPAVTAPFMSYGTGPVADGTVVPAVSPANPQSGIIAGGGTVYSFNPNAKDASSTLRLEAWGFRQPYGLAFNPFHRGQLFVTNNGIDLNGGVRLVNNDYDALFAVQTGLKKAQFFGWPDYFHDPQTGKVLPVSNPVFSTTGTPLQPVLDSTFSNSLKVQPLTTQLGYHVGADQLDFSTSSKFGHVGDMFIAESGAIVPDTGATQFAGYQVVRVNPKTGRTSNFITPISRNPDQLFNPAGFDKPVDVKFRGNTMYIVDLGAFEPGINIQDSNTGKIWVVTKN